MARYRVLHWKEIPSLVEAIEGDEVVRVPLSPRFQELIDAVAMRDGASGADAYLEGWGQSPDGERPGSAAEVAEQMAAFLESGFPDLMAEHLRPPV